MPSDNPIKRIAAFAVGVLTTALVATAAAFPDTMHRAQPEPVILGPYVLHIASLRWDVPNDSWWSHDTERLLSMRYWLTKASDGSRCDSSALAHNIEIRAYAPRHQPHWSIVSGKDNGSVLIPNLDPSQPGYRFDFILSDPNATPQQLGEARNDIVLDAIPVDPSRPGRQTIDRRYFTAFGQVCHINNMILRFPAHGDQGQTSIDVSIDQAPANASIKTVFEDRASLTDAQGQPIGDQFGASVALTAGHWILAFSGIPATRSLGLRFALDETASQTDPSILYHGSTYVPSANIAMPVSAGGAFTLASATSGSLNARIDRYHIWRNGSAAARIWLFDSDLSSNREWEIERVTGVWPGGIASDLATQDQQHWLLSGLPAPPGENGYAIYVDAPKSAQSLQPIRLSVTAHPTIRTERDIEFADLPIPAAGRSLIVNRAPDADDESHIHIVRISSVKDALAVVVESLPNSQATVDVKISAATDNRGLWLLPRGMSIVTQTDSSAASAKNSQASVYLLHTPSQSAAALDIVLHVTTKKNSGCAQTVVLTGIDSVPATD